MEMMKISYQMKILHFRNGQAILKTFIKLKPMRVSMTEFTTKFCLKKLVLEDGMLYPFFERNSVLNVPISHSEVKRVVTCAQNGKSSGFDRIPYNVLNFPIIIDILHALFNFCFGTVILSSVWKKTMIVPIPKD